MRTYRVVHVLEIESFVDAESEDEAVLLAKEGLDALTDGGTVVDERVTVWSEETEDE